MDEIDHDIEMSDLNDSVSVSGLSSTSTTTNETTGTATTNKTTGTTTTNETNETTGTGEAASENKSPVWKSFEPLENEPKAKCKYCNKILSHKKGYGTSHLRRHLKSCLKYQSSVSNGASFTHPNGQTQLSFNSSVNRLPFGNSNRENLAYMIIFDELNFQFVEKQGFRKFVNGILPGFTISADTIKRDIMKAYDKRKAVIKAILQNAEGKISLTCDTWTSLQQLGYMAITAHFFDKNWKLVSVLLSFKLIPYSHTGSNIANCIKADMDDYFITTKVMN